MSKKGENIYKRKDGRWEARYIKGYSASGSALYGYCYDKTYAGAKEKAIHARSGMLNNVAANGSGTHIRLSDFCDEWLRLKRSKVKKSTYSKYRETLDLHIKPKLGGISVRSLSPPLIEQFGYELMQNDNLSAKTAKDILTVLHSVLKYASQQVPLMPHIDMVYPKAERKEMRVLSREEQKQFMNYLLIGDDMYRFGTMLALLTGLRVGEICALKWGDISIENRTVSVERTMQRIRITDTDSSRKTEISVSDPKSFSSRRIVPLSRFALDLCKKYAMSDKNAYVLTGRADRFTEPRALQYRMKKYADACGLNGLHFHSLRHSFATRCIEVGFEIKSLSEVLGHASPQITLERYVHSSLALKKENMDKLSAIGY